MTPLETATSSAKANESSRKQLAGLPIPLPIEDIVPLVEGAQVEGEFSDADDGHVVQDANPLKQLRHSRNDSERKRSLLDDVPIQMQRITQGITTASSRHDQLIPSSMRARFERPLGLRVSGLRVHGVNRRRPKSTSNRPHWGQLTKTFEDGDEAAKMLDDTFNEPKNNAVTWEKVWLS